MQFQFTEYDPADMDATPEPDESDWMGERWEEDDFTRPYFATWEGDSLRAVGCPLDGWEDVEHGDRAYCYRSCDGQCVEGKCPDLFGHHEIGNGLHIVNCAFECRGI